MNVSCLTTEKGTIPLTAFDVRATIDELAAFVEIEQSYRNAERQAIEAVYTFPLPSEAALLSLVARIDGRELTGRAFAAAKADRDYEEAIDRGDLGILVERADDGLLTVSVGNLEPNAEVKIRIRYANWTRWEDDSIRFTFPTTIAPLYGQPHVAPHQEPVIDAYAERFFTFSAVLSGALANANVLSPSHAIKVAKTEGSCTIALDGDGRMNRDLILNLAVGERRRSFCVAATTDDTNIAIASVTPSRDDSNSPRSIVFVVDCSGSMSGESIAQAREALDHALGVLSLDDRFSIVRFGSTFEIVLDNVPVNRENIGIAHRVIRKIDADLGGTELLSAIRAATTLGEGAREIVLITDAHVTEIEALKPHGDDRIFVLAVSQGATEAIATHIAKTMRGATEFAIPSEDVKPKIARLMKKARSRKVVDLVWSGEPVATWSSNIAGGDALLFFAEYAHETGSAKYEGRMLDARLAPTEASSLLARLAIAARLDSLEENEAAALAEKHQLLSRWTKFVLIHEQQHEGAVGIPQVRKVPNELLNGYGGSGMALRCVDMADVVQYSMARPERPSTSRVLREFSLDQLEISARRGDQPLADLPPEVADIIEELRDEGFPDETIRVILLLVLDQLKHKPLSARERRQLRAQYTALQIEDEVLERVRDRVRSLGLATVSA